MKIGIRFTFLLFFIATLGGTELLGQETLIRVRDEVDFTPMEGVEVVCLNCQVLAKKPYKSDSKGVLRLGFIPKPEAQFRFFLPQFKTQSITFEKIQSQGGEVFLDPLSYTTPTVSIVSKFEQESDNVAQRVESIGTREIEFQNPQSSADLLIQTGGVFVQKSQMGGGSPNLRGFEANKVLIVVDGVRMNNAIYRGGHLQNVVTIDPNMVERTEVMFGPGSVIYGSDALGGVMHFYSKRPLLSTEKGKPNIKGNVFERYASANNELTGHVDLNVGFRKWGFISSVTGSSFGDLRAGANRPKAYPDFGKRYFYSGYTEGRDTMIPNEDVNVQKFSGYNQIDLMQKFIYVQNWRVTHTLNIQYSTSSKVPRYDRLSQYLGDSLQYSQWHYGPQKRFFSAYKGTIYGDSTFFDRMEWTGAYQEIEESRINRRFASTARRNRFEKVKVLSANLDAAKKFGSRHSLVYGLEAAHNIVSSRAFDENSLDGSISPLDTRYPAGGSVMRFLSAYVSHHWDINDKLSLTDGLRFSDVYLNSKFDDTTFFSFLPESITQHSRAVSGNLGVVAKPGKGWKLALLGSTGFRAPNVDDLGKVFDSSPGNVIIPNPNVTPEYTYNGEFTVTKRIDSIFKFEATGFYTFYDNALQVRNFQADGQDSILYDGVFSNVQANVNARQAYLYGANLNLWLSLRDRFVVTSTLSWTQGRDVTGGVPLDHIPPMFGKTSLQYHQKRFRGEFYVMYNGWKRLKDISPSGEDNQKFATPEGFYSWYTLNLKSTLAVTSNVRLQAGVENILDAHYRNFASGISAPGRNIIFALRVGF